MKNLTSELVEEFREKIKFERYNDRFDQAHIPLNDSGTAHLTVHDAIMVDKRKLEEALLTAFDRVREEAYEKGFESGQETCVE